MGLPEFSVKRRVTISMIVGVFMVLGVIAWNRIGVDLLPEMEFPMLSVLTQYPGVASEDIESLITKPIEEVAGSTKGVKKIRSFSQEGVSVVQVDLEWGTNMDVAAQDIRNAIGLIRDYMPADMREPFVLKFDTTSMPVVMFAMVAKSMSTYQLRRLVEDTLKEKLERLDGVASAMIIGGEQREILVEVDRDEMQARGQSLSEIGMMLGMQNLNMPGGRVVEGNDELLVRSLGEFRDVDDIGRMVVGMGQDMKPVRLRDIAKVANVPKEVRDYSRTNGEDCIMMIVMKESGANTLDASDKVLEELGRTGEYLPADIELLTFLDTGDFIRRTIKQTTWAGIQGGILAMLLILLFLKSIRPTLAIGIAIPLSVLFAFIPLYFVGYSINMMTLGGFALGVGMLVDNAVVVIENIFRHLELGEDRFTAAARGTREVGNAIISSTLTTVVVFLPMLFAEGIPGQLSKGVASTVAFSLMASLFVALTIVPMLASVFFRDKSEIAAKVKGATRYAKMQSRFQEGRIMEWVKDRYESVLRFTLRRWVRPVVFALVMLVAAGSGGLMFLVGAEFMPVSDQPFSSLKIALPVGTSLETTDRVVGQIEETLAGTPEIKVFGAWGGVSEATSQDVAYGSADAGVNTAQMFIKLSEKDERSRSSMAIIDELRKKMPAVEGGKFEFPDMNASMYGTTDKPIVVNVYGRDLATLKKLSERVIEAISGIEGLRDVDTSMRKGQPEIGVRIDRERAGSMGLTAGQVAAEIQAAMLGTIATAFRKGGEEFDVRLRYAPGFRSSKESLGRIPVKTPFGSYVLVSDIADIAGGTGAVKIDREGQMRKAVVGANYVDRDLASIVKDLKARLRPLEEKEFPSGYFTEVTGQYEQMKDFNDYLVLAFLLAILLVYMVMAAQFESFGQPFIVMFTMPLALIGVAILLFLTGNRFNVPSGMGVVILAGIVVNNGIILIDFVNQLRDRGLSEIEALVEGGRTRLRPILITSLTTIIGMLPMVWDRGDGSEMRSPMAITIIGGLTTSTFLTLVFIPVVYSLFDSVSRRLGFKRQRITIRPESPGEPVPAPAPVAAAGEGDL